MKGFFVHILSMLLFLPCSFTFGGERDSLTAIIESVKEHYAPDERLSVFQIKIKFDGDILILTGDVDAPEVKRALLDTLQYCTKAKILDDITVLPSPTLGEDRYGIVTLSVADIRKSPDNRKEMTTQALMGTVVTLMKEGRLFWMVKLPDGYIGWMKRSAFARTSKKGIEVWEQSTLAIVTGYFGIVRTSPSDTSIPVSDVVMGCILMKRDSANGWTVVELPDGRQGFLRSDLIEDYGAWKQTRNLTPESLENTALMFYGFPYLWGGNSIKGFDCSGFTSTVYRMNGMELLRDAELQATMGSDVDASKNFTNLRKGDLLFFGEKATKKKEQNIKHVAMYLDTLTFIHCAGNVHYNSFSPKSQYYNSVLVKSFLFAKRILN